MLQATNNENVHIMTSLLHICREAEMLPKHSVIIYINMQPIYTNVRTCSCVKTLVCFNLPHISMLFKYDFVPVDRNMLMQFA